MSLDYNLTKVKDTNILHNVPKVKGDDPPFPKGSEEDKQGDWEWAVTESIIWRSMFIRMGSITEANYEKYFVRLKIAEAVLGAPLYRMNEKGAREDVSITLADVKRRIGLSTNVMTETDTKFRKAMFDSLERDAQQVLNNQKRDMEKEAA